MKDDNFERHKSIRKITSTYVVCYIAMMFVCMQSRMRLLSHDVKMFLFSRNFAQDISKTIFSR